MMWRIALGCLLLIGGLLALTACYPQDRPPPYIGPISKTSTFGTPNGGMFAYELTSSTNCGFIGNPIRITLVVTNTTSVTYIDSLPLSIFDIQIETRKPQTWLWSETVPPTEQLKSVSLTPNQSIKLQWLWTIDPALRLERFPPELYIEPIVRYRDVGGHNGEMEGGSYLRIPLGFDSAAGICPDIKP